MKNEYAIAVIAPVIFLTKNVIPNISTQSAGNPAHQKNGASSSVRHCNTTVS